MVRVLALMHAGADLVTPATLFRSWSVEWVPLTGIALTLALYVRGVARLRARAGRVGIVRTSRVASCYAGLATLLIALDSPLDSLADSLFVAHMIQHTLLIAVAAPLLAYGSVPLLAFWGLGDRLRVALGRIWVRIGLRRVGHLATGAFAAWLLHTLALWLWHLPGPYATALRSPWVHAAEHLSFLLTALLLWTVVFPAHERHRPGAAPMAMLAGTFVQTGALGAVLTLSATPWYYSQSAAAGAWGLTALADQQLAGLVMWIPPSVVYVSAVLGIMRRWLVSEEGSDRAPAA